MFWGIEVCSPDSSSEDEYCFMISVIASMDVHTAYLLLLGDIDESLIRSEITPRVLRYDNESEMLKGFFNLWLDIQPDNVISYNGDNYDVPYLITRAQMLGVTIPSLGALTDTDDLTEEISYPSHSGDKIKSKSFCAPGVNIIDLIHYFRKMYPGQNSYSLETVTQSILSEGKTSLDIKEMCSIVRSGNPQLMARVGTYSVTDSYLLYRLWDTLDIGGDLKRICNGSCLTFEQFLRYNENDMFNSCFKALDPALELRTVEVGHMSHISPMTPGVYTNVKVYSYERLIDSALNIVTSTHPYRYLRVISDRAQFMPCSVYLKVLYSSVVPGQARDALNEMIGLIEGVMAVDFNYIYLDSEVTHPQLDYIKNIAVLVQESSSCKIEAYDPSTIFRYGMSDICSPNCPLARQVTNNVIIQIMAGKRPYLKVPDLSDEDVPLLIMNASVRSASSYSRGCTSIQATLSGMLASSGVNFTTWMRVKYVMLKTGPYIISDEQLPAIREVDVYFYIKSLKTIYQKLTNLLMS
jgi:hypothetical protein